MWVMEIGWKEVEQRQNFGEEQRCIGNRKWQVWRWKEIVMVDRDAAERSDNFERWKDFLLKEMSLYKEINSAEVLS